MSLLELCCGTQSIGKVFKSQGWEVVSIDVDPGAFPTSVTALLDFDYRSLGGICYAIWASPPCTMHNIARSKAKTPRDLEGADKIVNRCKDILKHVDPPCWCIEHPQSGVLKTRDRLLDLPYIDITYCSYGCPYRKTTQLLTNGVGAECPPRMQMTVKRQRGGTYELGTEGGAFNKRFHEIPALYDDTVMLPGYFENAMDMIRS